MRIQARISKEKKDKDGNIYYGRYSNDLVNHAKPRKIVCKDFDKYCVERGFVIGKQTPFSIMRKFFNIFHKNLIEYRSGGLLGGIGYFFHFYSPLNEPYKGRPKMNGRKVYNRKYRTCFLPTCDSSPLRYYSLDFQNHHEFKRKFRVKFKNMQYRYLNMMNYVVPAKFMYDTCNKKVIKMATAIQKYAQ